MQINLAQTRFLTHSMASLLLLRLSPESTLTRSTLPVVPGHRGPRRRCCGLNLSPCLTFSRSLARSLGFCPRSYSSHASRRQLATCRRGSTPSPPPSLVGFQGMGSKNSPCRVPFAGKVRGFGLLFVFILFYYYFFVSICSIIGTASLAHIPNLNPNR